MMIVASTRMGKAQRALDSARVYGSAEGVVYDKSEAKPAEAPGKTLLIAMTSDKGLCGSIHSQLARTARAYLNEHPDTDLVVVGDKLKAQLSRSHPDNLRLSFAGVGKDAPTFSEAALIADEVVKLGKYDSIKLLYNRKISSMAHDPRFLEVFSDEALKASSKFGQYELEEEDALSNFGQFHLANTILTSLVDGHAAEISARRNAMDSASKNAGDMIAKNSILYNRTRQSVITNELVDIVTGASALQ